MWNVFCIPHFLCKKNASDKKSDTKNGDNGARTRDLLTASQALSQLSYTPILSKILVRKKTRYIWWERADSNHRSRSNRFTVCPI